MRGRPYLLSALLALLLPDQAWLVLLASTAALGCIEKSGPVLTTPPTPAPPEPVSPLPSAEQLAWQAQELTAFFHFGINTFTGREIGDGKDSPTLFDPASLDAAQWITALGTGRFRQAMLTAKHHDGFCLWPTKCTSYSVAASPFRGGQGDVVREFVDAARQGGVRVGLALSPLDYHEPSYGTPAYETVFKCQLSELLTEYGSIDEIWLWTRPSAPNFDWVAIGELVHELQPQTLLNIADSTPTPGTDIRSIGKNVLGDPTLSDQSSVQIPSGGASAVWMPAEAVYSIRPAWFWHAADDSRVQTTAQLLSLYIDSVGRNSVLRLNIPPNTQGLLADPDVASLSQLSAAVDELYRTNLAAGRSATADSVFGTGPTYSAMSAVDGKLDSFWAAAVGATSGRLEVDLGGPQSFDLLSIQEPIALGERVTQYHIEARTAGTWTTIASATTIGERNLLRVSTVTADRVALVLTAVRGAPAIAELGVYQSLSDAGVAP